jgi:hypothetical protein
MRSFIKPWELTWNFLFTSCFLASTANSGTNFNSSDSRSSYKAILFFDFCPLRGLYKLSNS